MFIISIKSVSAGTTDWEFGAFSESVMSPVRLSSDKCFGSAALYRTTAPLLDSAPLLTDAALLDFPALLAL